MTFLLRHRPAPGAEREVVRAERCRAGVSCWGAHGTVDESRTRRGSADASFRGPTNRTRRLRGAYHASGRFLPGSSDDAVRFFMPRNSLTGWDLAVLGRAAGGAILGL